MKLSKRNGVYVLDWRDPMGKRQRKSLGTRDRDEAERRAHDLMTGKDTRSGSWSLRLCMEHCLAHVWSDAKSYRTFESLTRQVSEQIGHMPINEVTYEFLKQWAFDLRRAGMAPATVNRRLAAIGRALKEAVREGKLAAVPPMPKQVENNKRLRWLSEDEEAKLMSSCACLTERDARVMRQVVVFLIDTGARMGEMLKLQPDQIDERGARFEDTKSAAGKYKARTVPLTDRALVAAREIAARNRLGLSWSASQVAKRLERVCRDAGLKGVTCHTFRHTCASRLVQRGADLYRVQQWLGHSTITVTERYAHLSSDSLSEMVTLLDTHAPGLSTDGHSASNVSHFPTRKVR